MSKKRRKKNLWIIKHSNPQLPQKKMRMIHFSTVENLVGFALETAQSGEMAKIQTRGSLVSDTPLFYTYIDHISGIFLKNVLVGHVFQFLVLIHENLSADLYINDLPVKILMMTKRSLKKGEVVTSNDIADIQKLSFEGIGIKDTDKVIYCFKVGWKFGLFFDLHREKPLDIATMEAELGALYRYLSFQYVYDILESGPQFELLLKDGWFPFIEILSGEFKELSEAYKNLSEPQTKVQEIVAKFDEKRIEHIVNKWWNKEIFSDKKTILESGIQSYLNNDAKGFIACIKILLTEIEGIIRIHYFKQTGKGKEIHILDLINHICDQGKNKSGSETSLFFPSAFFHYLKEAIFPKFDLETDNNALSRHTSSHGVAKAEDYSKTRAVQMILILDQMSFYI
jgi:hypothetical protein